MLLPRTGKDKRGEREQNTGDVVGKNPDTLAEWYEGHEGQSQQLPAEIAPQRRDAASRGKLSREPPALTRRQRLETCRSGQCQTVSIGSQVTPASARHPISWRELHRQVCERLCCRPELAQSRLCWGDSRRVWAAPRPSFRVQNHQSNL